jgi:acyl carrier protein
VTAPNAMVVKIQKLAEALIGYDVGVTIPLEEQGFDSIDLEDLLYQIEGEYGQLLPDEIILESIEAVAYCLAEILAS